MQNGFAHVPERIHDGTFIGRFHRTSVPAAVVAVRQFTRTVGRLQYVSFDEKGEMTMKRLKKSAMIGAMAACNGVMIVGSIAAIVVKDFFENPVEAYKHQAKQGFLSADFWTN